VASVGENELGWPVIRFIKWLFGRDGTTYVFPPEIKAQCRLCLKDAQAIAAANGYRDKGKIKRLRVLVREAATRQFAKGWGWQENGKWVLGLAHDHGHGSYTVEVGPYPHDEVLIHEVIHVILMSSYGIREHISVFEDKAWGWNGSV